MSHSFRPGPMGLEQSPVRLHAVVSIGNTGAPTVTRGLSKGIKSVVRNSAGNYTLTLDQPYKALLGFTARVLTPTTGISAGPHMGLVAQAVATASAPTLNFVFSGATNSGTTTLQAKELASGSIVYFTIDLANSSAV